MSTSMYDRDEIPSPVNLPSEWDWVTFGSIVTFSQYGLNNSSGEGDLFPMLRMNNLQIGRVDTTDLTYIRLSQSELSKFALQKGDLLVNRTNSYDLVGKTALFELNELFVFASYLVRFRLDTSKVVPRYISYWFNSDKGQQSLKKIATKGVSQANINPTILQQQFLILLPPLPEQHKITNILKRCDEAIELTAQLIAAKQLRKQALMHRLLTGKVRFPGFEGQCWREVLLGETFTERKETGYVHIPLLSITSEQGIIYRDTLEKRDTSSEDKSKYLRILPGDIGYNTMRMWQGVSAVSRLEGIVSPAYTICIPNQDEVDVNFMGYLFKFAPIVHLFWRFSQGLVDDTRNLKFDNFAQIKVRIPHKEEQQKIAGILEMCDQEIGLLQQKLTALRQQKQGLMQQLLTGKIRVKV